MRCKYAASCFDCPLPDCRSARAIHSNKLSYDGSGCRCHGENAAHKQRPHIKTAGRSGSRTVQRIVSSGFITRR